jgi:hypothetical protein
MLVLVLEADVFSAYIALLRLTTAISHVCVIFSELKYLLTVLAWFGPHFADAFMLLNVLLA